MKVAAENVTAGIAAWLVSKHEGWFDAGVFDPVSARVDESATRTLVVIARDNLNGQGLMSVEKIGECCKPTFVGPGCGVHEVAKDAEPFGAGCGNHRCEA